MDNRFQTNRWRESGTKSVTPARTPPHSVQSYAHHTCRRPARTRENACSLTSELGDQVLVRIGRRRQKTACPPNQDLGVSTSLREQPLQLRDERVFPPTAGEQAVQILPPLVLPAGSEGGGTGPP